MKIHATSPNGWESLTVKSFEEAKKLAAARGDTLYVDHCGAFVIGNFDKLNCSWLRYATQVDWDAAS